MQSVTLFNLEFFATLHMSVNNHEGTTSVNFGVTNFSKEASLQIEIPQVMRTGCTYTYGALLNNKKEGMMAICTA